MEPQIYTWMAQVEDRHWWFASRRAIVEHFIDRMNLAPDAAILEPGCGTGGNFAMLARHGRVYAMDSEDDSLRFATARRIAQVERGILPDQIPFGSIDFDFILMCDVLEHLDDDAAALQGLRARLKPGGWLLMTVPALQWLWSGHDQAHHHRRRYRASDLGPITQAAGFDVLYLGYFNFILFPAVAAVRLAQRLTARTPNGTAAMYTSMPPRIFNTILTRVFSSERRLLDHIHMPFGVSLLLLARPSASTAIAAAADRAH
ncbi:MAG: class I SAM-dependent methyltransferase [Candidatus Binataceae bacterium]|jgi:SAM-dependent methyltransferase